MPFVWMVYLSLHESVYALHDQQLGLHQFQRAVTPPFSGIILNSLNTSLAASFCVLLIALPISWFISRQPKSVRNFWLAAFSIPLALNFVVRIYAWFVLIRPEGLLTRVLQTLGYDDPLASTPSGVFFALIYGYLPLMFLPLFVVFERVDQNLLDAALDLGANRKQRWTRIILPEILPGVIASFLFVFVPMLGEYLIPRMIGGGLIATLGTQIEGQFLGSTRPNWPFGAALSLCLLVCAAAILFVGLQFLSRRERGQTSTWSILQIR